MPSSCWKTSSDTWRLGKTRLEAALLASREIGFTIVSMTLSLVAVFIPVLFLGGMVGRILHEFSVTIIVAILISGFVSLTFTPMLGSRYLPAHKQKTGKWSRKSFWLADMTTPCRRSCDIALRR